MDGDGPIALRGQCDIRTVRENHAALLAAFRSREEIEIDAAGAEQVDVTVVQLLASATLTAAASNKRLRLVAASEPLRRALERAGLGYSQSDGQITWS